MTSIAELKVVEYVLRHTWGFQEYGIKKHITNDEFMHGRRTSRGERIDQGTGLSKKSVIAGLKLAISHGLLLEEVDDSDKGRIKKYYSLKMASEPDDGNQQSPASSASGPIGVGEKIGNSGVTKVYPPGAKSIPRTEKETLERNLNNVNVKKKIGLQKKSAIPDSDQQPPPPKRDNGMRRMGELLDKYQPTSPSQAPPKVAKTDQDQVLRRDAIAIDLAKALNDSDGLGCYRVIASQIPPPIIFQLLSETEQLNKDGKINTKPAAFFVYKIKQYAQAQGLDLDFAPT